MWVDDIPDTVLPAQETILEGTYPMTLLFLSLLLGSGSAMSEVPQASATCPAEAQVHRSTLNHLVSSPALATARDRVGLGGIDLTQVRVLSNATDHAVCERLNTMAVEGGQIGSSDTPWVYYQLGNRYIAVSASVPPVEPGMLSTRTHFVAVLDLQFNFLVGYGI